MTAEPGAAMTRSAMTMFFTVLILLAGLPGIAGAQSREGESLQFEELPGYANYRKISEARRKLNTSGRASRIKWSADGKSVGYSVDGEKRQLSLIDGTVGQYNQVDHEPAKVEPTRRRRPVARARQRTVEPSPDGKWQAVYRENNLFIESVPEQSKQKEEQDEEQDQEQEEAAEQEEVTVYQVTDQGRERLRYGTCCWVYGEELDQQDAMWWSPDGTKLVFYEVDEAGMKDYYLTEKNADVYTELHTVRYPKAGYDRVVTALDLARDAGADRLGMASLKTPADFTACTAPAEEGVGAEPGSEPTPG